MEALARPDLCECESRLCMKWMNEMKLELMDTALEENAVWKLLRGPTCERGRSQCIQWNEKLAAIDTALEEKAVWKLLRGPTCMSVREDHE